MPLRTSAGRGALVLLGQEQKVELSSGAVERARLRDVGDDEARWLCMKRTMSWTSAPLPSTADGAGPTMTASMLAIRPVMPSSTISSPWTSILAKCRAGDVADQLIKRRSGTRSCSARSRVA